ncbi:TIGR02646 family protein [Tumidithrix helvetica PCC 7403]|uniref:hypothetical protein n=1 Tax=Tumidithrix helvetica TaxID=3457545 RepID=UPI003C80C7E4
MIHIKKSSKVPEKLTIEGKKKRRSHCSSYSRNPSAYQEGKEFKFASSIYAHDSVKQALIEDQHQKCCFCERLTGTDGDVEHFRPKQAYKQANGESLQRPGYYWLAYEWDNLYLSCSACNQRHKQNLFPLQNPSERATHHKQNVDREQPLFIDPSKDNPEEFIGFRGEFAYAIDDNPRGIATIELLKLNLRSLDEARLQRLQILKRQHDILEKALNQPHNSELQNLARIIKYDLEKATKDEAEFAAAARCAIRSGFQFVSD